MKQNYILNVRGINGKYYTSATIKKLKHHGRVATSKHEPIGETDKYWYNQEIFFADITPPPAGAQKVVAMHYFFKDVTTNPGDKINVECDLVDNKFIVKQSYYITLKKIKNKFI